MKLSFIRNIAAFALLILFNPSTAFAACPDNEQGQPGQEGEIEYFNDNVLRFCDGTNWNDMTENKTVNFDNSLVGHWLLNETSGNIANDKTGNNNLTMQGAMTAENTSVEGLYSSALSFDGNQTIAKNNPQNLPAGNSAFTMATWIRSNTVNERDIVFGWGEVAFGRAAMITIESGGNIRFTGHGAAHDWDSSAAITQGTWHHIAVTHPANSDNINFYLDGGYIDTISKDNLNINPTIIQIGDGPTFSNPFDGSLADVRIYNEALNASQITDIYNWRNGIADCPLNGGFEYNASDKTFQWCNGNKVYNMAQPASGSGGCPQEGSMRYEGGVYQFCDGNGWVDITGIITPEDFQSSLVWYLKLDETGATTTAVDSAGSNPGTMNGGLSGANNVNGAVGTALNFDGSDDYIEAVGYKGVTGSNARSISAWFNISNSDNNNLFQYGSGNGSDKGMGLRLRIENGEVWGRFYEGVVMICGSGFNDGSWHHMVFSYPESASINNAKLYIDGVEQTCSFGEGDEILNTSSDMNVTLGVDAKEGLMEAYYNGSMDDVRLYDKALSGEEVNALYRLGYQ